LLGRLAEEFGPERVVPVAFHVDYFDEPWKDPFSDPTYSRREMQYSVIYDREHKLKNPGYLYLTPLVMIDGRTPMVGSNEDAPARAREAIRKALARRAEVTLRPTLEPDGDDARKRTLRLEVAAASTGLVGREVIVEVVIVEDGLRTKVGAGELKGEEYVGHNVARKFAFRSVRLSRKEPEALRFPVELEEGWDPARCRVVVIAQDEKTGRIYQARMIGWSGR
jgi:hypothetical protein